MIVEASVPVLGRCGSTRKPHACGTLSRYETQETATCADEAGATSHEHGDLQIKVAAEELARAPRENDRTFGTRA